MRLEILPGIKSGIVGRDAAAFPDLSGDLGFWCSGPAQRHEGELNVTRKAAAGYEWARLVCRISRNVIQK